MKTIHVEEQSFTKKMFGVLKRNEELNITYLYKTKDFECDKEKFVEYAKDNFPGLYKEAESIVNDPDRKLVYVYADDIDHLLNENNNSSLEKNDLYNVISDFVEEYNLQQQFSDFLKAAEKDEDKREYYAFVLDELLNDFIVDKQ